MTTVNDILTQFQSFKAQVNAYYQLIYNEVDDDATLDGLTSASKTAEYNLWMWLFAAMSVIVNSLWLERKAEIQAIADAAISGTELWLRKEVMKFQYGDTLSFDDDNAKYFYAVIDPTKQIIARCAVVSAGTVSTVKVAKLSGSVPIALTAPELAALTSYVDRIEWAGMQIIVLSLNTDLLNAPMTVYYNGQIPLVTMRANVEAAYNNYLANLPFNGQYSITKHIDAIQAVAEVNDVVAGAIQAKVNLGAYVPVARIYNPLSGYLTSDPAISLTTLITYVAQ